MKYPYLIIALSLSVFVLAGCTQVPTPAPTLPPTQIEQSQEQPEQPEQPEPPTQTEIEVPIKQMTNYLQIVGEGVRVRTGASTTHAVIGMTQKDTLLALLGEEGGWYKTYYQNRIAYVSKRYAKLVQMESNQTVESIIMEGCKLLGTPYVYGAVRYHDGSGNRLKGFTVEKFDCSSLMQYIFYKGANRILQVTTRTQVVQGQKVTDLQRGDLLFFTNDQRVGKSGIERVGHVALYLGDDYILHTASDFAKIERMTQKRWNYFLEARRMI